MDSSTTLNSFNQQPIWIIPTDSDTEKKKSIQDSDNCHDVEFEKAVSLTGGGMFHTTIALVCGFSFLAAGLQNNLNAYILPSARCDLKLTSNEMGLLNAVFLAGGLASGFLWGVLADMIGRKKVLVSGMLIDGLLSLASSLSQHFYVLIIFRFFNGFIVGGPSAIVLAYMGEFFSERIRAKVICYVGLLWTMSWVIMPAVAWFIIPMRWSIEVGGIIFNSWRLLVAIVAIPSLLSAILLSLYPESPRWLLSQGRSQEARDVLASIYSWNNSQSSDKFSVISLRCEEQKSFSKEENTNSVWQAISILIQQGQSLFMLPTLKTTALTCSLFFSNMFGYYGLGLWLPELFNRFELHYLHHPNESVSVCELSGPMNKGAELENCDSNSVDSTVFVNSLIIGVAGLSGNIISGFLSGRLRRRTMPVYLMIASGLCVLTIYFLQSSFQNLIVSAVFQLCVGTANLVFNSLVVDMFPPSISGMGVCLAILSGRLGAMVSNLVFGHLLDISCAVPILLVAAVCAGGGFLSFLIPDEPYSEDKTFMVKKATIT
ncbi:synaptic vesicle glycoprotein 2C-like [Lycorma delicatula]|uniref:synaptic vesicle glycoprotein 2C-like n=1 Tax=Lycorma delicatula TaxID=130591 RepID=UPI003F5157EA